MYGTGAAGDGASESLLSPGPPAFSEALLVPDSVTSGDGSFDFPPVPGTAAPEYAPPRTEADDELVELQKQYGSGNVGGGQAAASVRQHNLMDDDLLQLDDAVALGGGGGNGVPQYAEVHPDQALGIGTGPVYAEIGPAISGLSIDGADASGPAGYLEVDGTAAAQNAADGLRSGATNYLEVDRTPASASASASVSASGAAGEQALSAPSAAAEFSRPVTFVGGQLPDDFLTLMVPTEVPILAPGQIDHSFPEAGVLTVILDQARLARNYGIGRMDPYVRLSVGAVRQCSQVCVNGSKTPFWNSRVTLNLPEIADFEIKVEVLSQGTFSDRLVGWAEVPLIEAYQGKRIDDWIHLTGKQGKDKEGVIHMIVSFQRTEFVYQPVPGVPHGYAMQPAPPLIRNQVQSEFGLQYAQSYPNQPAHSMPPPGYGGGGGLVQGYPAQGYPVQGGGFGSGGPPPSVPQQQQQVYSQQQQHQQQPQRPQQPQQPYGGQQQQQVNGNTGPALATPVPEQPHSAQAPPPGAIQQLKDMFPSFDNSIIEGVLAGTQGNVEQAIESLLSMS